MLKNIKSYYIVKIVFLYVYERQKLKIVKYNKSLQKINDISINNYKHFYGRYIIYDSNRIGKEYFASNNKLYYAGEYLNGERNGKGKEYWNDGSLRFEGEYLNGERNGNGKEYFFRTLTYEGEYLNGKKHGQGKEYYYNNGKLKFEGEYLNGEQWIGTRYDDKGNILFKSTKNGKRKEYDFDNRLIFEGEYLNGKKMEKEKNMLNMVK